MARPLHPGRHGALLDLFYSDFNDVKIAERNGMSRRMVHLLAKEWNIDMALRTKLRDLIAKKRWHENQLRGINAEIEELNKK